jgi:signal peptidase II
MERTRVIPFVIATSVFILDRVTKWLVETRVGDGDTITVIPGFFNIVHSQNPGAAFGILASASASWRGVLLIGVSSVILVFLAAFLWQISSLKQESSGMLRTGLALIVGGAVGNVFDRIRAGSVTDFLDFYWGSYHWYTFNVADSAISCGAALLILDMLRPKVRVPGAA